MFASPISIYSAGFFKVYSTQRERSTTSQCFYHHTVKFCLWTKSADHHVHSVSWIPTINRVGFLLHQKISLPQSALYNILSLPLLIIKHLNYCNIEIPVFFISESRLIRGVQLYLAIIPIAYSRLRNKHRGTLINFWIFSRGYVLIQESNP